MPVILAVGLIVAKGLMDLAAATSAPGPKGDTGAAGAAGPQGILSISKHFTNHLSLNYHGILPEKRNILVALTMVALIYSD